MAANDAGWNPPIVKLSTVWKHVRFVMSVPRSDLVGISYHIDGQVQYKTRHSHF